MCLWSHLNSSGRLCRSGCNLRDHNNTSGCVSSRITCSIPFLFPLPPVCLVICHCVIRTFIWLRWILRYIRLTVNFICFTLLVWHKDDKSYQLQETALDFCNSLFQLNISVLQDFIREMNSLCWTQHRL